MEVLKNYVKYFTHFLSMGLSVEDIAKATSLSIEQVEAIKAE